MLANKEYRDRSFQQWSSFKQTQRALIRDSYTRLLSNACLKIVIATFLCDLRIWPKNSDERRLWTLLHWFNLFHFLIFDLFSELPDSWASHVVVCIACVTLTNAEVLCNRSPNSFFTVNAWGTCSFFFSEVPVLSYGALITGLPQRLHACN